MQHNLRSNTRAVQTCCQPSQEGFYRALIRRKIQWIFLAAALLIALFFTDILTGPMLLSPQQVFCSVFLPERVDPNVAIIVKVMRLPVAVMAIVVGGSLGVAGAEMQTILNNPLASPYTLGISSAASFGAALAIIAGKNFPTINGFLIVPLSAFACAVLSSMLLNFITKRRFASSHAIILIGVTISFLFSTLLSFLQYAASENELQAIVFWMFGSLQGATWTKIGIIALALAITIPALLKNAWKLTALTFGDEKVKSMGVNVSRLRVRTLFLVAVLTAVSVCFVGTIGFVGLVAPHLSRVLVGEDQRFFMPCSAILGGIMLSFSSIASKMILPGTIFPVGITTSLIGIPFLLFIIFKNQR